MKTLITLTAVLSVSVCALAAQAGDDHYDLAAEVTLKGTVARIAPHHERGRTWVHVILAAGSQTIEVHLGPKQYLEIRGYMPPVGASIVVTATRAKGEKERHYLARTFSTGKRTITLRDKTGKPLWPE